MIIACESMRTRGVAETEGCMCLALLGRTGKVGAELDSLGIIPH